LLGEIVAIDILRVLDICKLLLLMLLVVLLAVKNISWICVLQADAQNIDSCLPEIKLYRTFLNLLKIVSAPCHEWAE